MRPISSERFVRILAHHHEWDVLARFALRMAEVERLYRDDPDELVRRAIALADQVSSESAAMHMAR